MRYGKSMSEALADIREGFTPKQIKMAIGIASDKRYAGGNMTGAVKAIEKIKKGLSDHPQVAAVLKRQNEKLDQEDEPFVKDLVKKLRKGSATHGKQADDLEKALDEDGHTDVASAQNNVKVAMSALTKMSGELAKLNPEDALPSWWTNKVAVAVDKLDGMADYLDTQVEEVEIDEGKMKQFHMMQTDGKSAEEIAKALKLDLKTVKDLMKEEVELDEMKMDDPKLVKTFDKLKRGDTVKLKTSSTINQGKDFVEYIVKAKNTVNKGRVEKITLVTKGNEKAVKKFLYKRDGKVTFAIGDMGASIDDIKEGVEPIQWPSQPLEEKLKVSDGLGAWIDDFKKSDAPQFAGKSDEEKKNMAIAAFTDAGGKLDEETELDEAPKMKYALVGKDMKIYSMGSDERDLRLDRRSLEQRFKDAAPLKMARLKTAQSIGDKVDKSQLKEEEEPNKPDTAKAVDQGREDKKKTRIAQLQLQIAKAQETINKLNAQEKPNG